MRLWWKVLLGSRCKINKVILLRNMGSYTPTYETRKIVVLVVGDIEKEGAHEAERSQWTAMQCNTQLTVVKERMAVECMLHCNAGWLNAMQWNTLPWWLVGWMAVTTVLALHWWSVMGLTWIWQTAGSIKRTQTDFKTSFIESSLLLLLI